MRTRGRLLIASVLLLLLGGAVWNQFAVHRVPAGQAPLAMLDQASFETFAEQFNLMADQTRVVLLLSPT